MKKLLAWAYFPYRWLIYVPFMAVSTLFFGTLTVVLVQFISARKASFIGGTIWARLNAYMTPMFVRVFGREHLDRNRSYVVVSNHVSQFDIFVLYGWLGVDFKWVMKKELRKIPALGVACEKLGHVFIDRSNHTAAMNSLREAKSRITNGTSVLFFPEGTRSSTGKMGPFKKGAFSMALDLDLPILPVSIINTDKILPNGTLKLLPGRARLVIHPPVEVKGYSRDNVEALMDRTRAVIQGGLDEYAF